MPIRKILVGHDESPPADRALALAADLAEEYDARLVLLTVLPPLPSVAPDTASISDVTRARIDTALRMLRQRAERLRTEGRSVGHLVEIGDPTERLLDLADRLEVDVTVLGRSGKGAVARLLMGSVTTSLLHQSKRPILVVP